MTLDDDISFSISEVEKAQLPSLASFLRGLNLLGPWQLPPTHKSHPLKSLTRCSLGGMDFGSLVARATDRALRALPTTGPVADAVKNWAKAASDSQDVANACGLMAQIRAVGSLCGARLLVSPIPVARGRGTSDLRISCGNQSATLEVTAKQMNGAEAQKLAAARKQILSASAPASGAVTTLTTRPAGVPKAGENTTLNVAHKIAGHSKGQAHQAERGTPHIVWMDFIDADWMGAADQVEPITLFREAFYSGGVWLGVYGRRGDPVIERLELGLFEDGTVPMTFDGMFAQTRVVSAVVCSFPERTVLFENPNARTRVSEAVRTALMGVPAFDFSRSFMGWPRRRSLRYSIARERTVAIGIVRRLEVQRTHVLEQK